MDLAVAQTLYARSKGLLGRTTLPAGSGLWITPCNGIHTIGMKFPIDALFLDRDNRVVGLARNLAPNRLSRVFFRSRSVLELPAGTLETAGTREGHQVEIAPGGLEQQPGPERQATMPILYLLLLAAHLALVWWLPCLPTQDGPSHLYNLVILNDLLHGGKEWGAYYTYALKAVPNLGFHLVGYPLLQLFSPLVTEKIFVSLYLVLVAACVPFLLRSFDRPAFPLSFLAFPVLFNYTLLMGFYSYSIAVPLFLAALSLVWRARHGSPLRSFATINLCGGALYFFHLTPWAFFLMSVGLQPLASDAGRLPLRPRLGGLIEALGRQALLMVPQLVLLGCYLAGSFPKSSHGYGYLCSGFRAVQLFEELLLFSTVTFSRLQLVPALVLLVTICLLVRATLRGPGAAATGLPESRQGCREPDGCRGQGTAGAERYFLALIAVLALIYFLAPFRLGEGAYFNDRFPWVIYLLSLPLFRAEPGTLPRLNRTLVAVACLFLASNAYFLAQQSGRIQDFINAAPPLPKGSQVMMYKDEAPVRSPVDPMLHAISYYCIARGYVDVGNYETRFSYFPVHFSPALPELPAPETIAYAPHLIRWTEFPSIEYVFGINPAGQAREGMARFFRILHEQGPFSVWQRRPEFRAPFGT